MDSIILWIPGPGRFLLKNGSWYLPELKVREFKNLSDSEKKSDGTYLRRYLLNVPYDMGWRPKYIPRVEVFECLNSDKDEVIYALKIKFSAPKLIYGNSVSEVTEADFEKVLRALRLVLANVGISVDSHVLANAEVYAVDFCKNIPLPRNIQMRKISTELMRMDLGKGVDVTMTKFKNGGQVLYFFHGSIEFVFYEKISDALRPKTIRVSRTQVKEEREIIDQHDLRNGEVFRYEHRLTRLSVVKREVNRVLQRDTQNRVLFQDLFAEGLHKRIILTTWYRLIENPGNLLALLDSSNHVSLFLHILSEAKKKYRTAFGMMYALVLYGLTRAIQDQGVKEVKRALSRIWNKDHPERLTKKFKDAEELAKGFALSNDIDYVIAGLERFEPIRGDWWRHLIELP